MEDSQRKLHDEWAPIADNITEITDGAITSAEVLEGAGNKMGMLLRSSHGSKVEVIIIDDEEEYRARGELQ